MLRVLVFGILLKGAIAQSTQVNEVKEIIESQSGKIRFECLTSQIKSPKVAAKARHAVKLAAEVLENVIALQFQIVIKLDYIKQCAGKRRCIPRFVGNAVPVYQRSDYNSKLSQYPQALLKQTKNYLFSSGTYGGHDMSIEMALDTDFYFPSDYPVNITNQQVDFMPVLIHEIIHGLGMQSRLKLHDMVFEFNDFYNIYISLYPAPFDYYIYDIKTNQSVIATLTALVPYTAPNRRQRFQDLYDAFHGGNRLYFHSIRGKNISLYSEKILAHVSEEYSMTKDDLMLHNTAKGYCITDYILYYTNWHEAPFGPAVLDILASIGYQLKVPDPKRSLQYYYQYKQIHNGIEPPTLPAFIPSQ
ncbi:hypothetical protein DSO57_1011426 [Entomophthora muscae]|uniref:Uncharacterized protein n=1 Tax=Entomophthora muscae TaxID=34485 RepID=A0ACC2URC0_9FUNG|nr:hypothetical protein DSO57_1011426 [Entomophthora muscae]